MKEYIRNKIIMTIEIIIILIVIFLIKKEDANLVSNFSIASLNTNLEKSVDVSIIRETQNELFSKETYNPLYTFTGELTGYGGDCPLCSGRVGCPPRINVLKEGIYYKDKTYGTVRIVASSKNYPCGTILRFNVKKLSADPIIAIVLDRGVSGNVIDLLTESEDYASKYVGRVKNLQFEVLREGWKK
jgi:hypothetical protein